MKLCERLFLLAGASRSTIWDAVAGSTGVMVYCYSSSVAMASGLMLDMSTVKNSDSKSFEGGIVLELRAGCYKGLVVIDGNSLYGTIMSRLSIYINRFASLGSLEGLVSKMLIDADSLPESAEINLVAKIKDFIFIRDRHEYVCVKMGTKTLLSTVLKNVIKNRKLARQNSKIDKADGYKFLTVSAFRGLVSKHGIISSKTCAKLVTYCARYY